MRKLISLLSVYGFATFLPILLFRLPLSGPVNTGYPLRWIDLLDFLFTPWIGVGIFALLYRVIPVAADCPSSERNGFRFLFFAFSMLYLEGHGMHLAADSINNWMTGTTPVTVQTVINFYDELFSHSIWYGGAMGLAIVTSAFQHRFPSSLRASTGQVVLLVAAGGLYGLGFGLFILEGQTATWVLPVLVVLLGVTLWVLWRDLNGLAHRPAWIFFITGLVCLLVVLNIWRFWFGDFSQPSTIFPQGP